MNETTRKYLTLYMLNLKTIKDNQEYHMGIEFMNGYPRMVVRSKDDKYPKMKVTFTILGLLTTLLAMKRAVEDDKEITVDSSNYKYENDKRTDELESVGKITIRKHETGAFILNFKDKENEFDFPILLDRKFFNFYRNGADINHEMYKLTALSYIDALRQTAIDISNYQLVEAKKEKEHDDHKG